MNQIHARPEFIPTLAGIFFGQLANWWRKRRARRGGKASRLRFEGLENRLLLSADLVFNAADNLASDYTLRLDSDSGNLELLDGERVVTSQALAETSRVVINGEDGQDDSLRIDFNHGGFFSLEGGITFNGGADGFDALEVTGGAFTAVTHTITDTDPGLSGTMVYEDGLNPALTINYTGLEPVDMTGSTIADLVFNLPGTDDQAILEDDAAALPGVSQIRSQNATPTFDTTTFSNPTSSLTINMGGDDGTFTVSSLPDFTAALTINGQAGADTVTFTGTATFAALTVTVGGPITDAAGTSLTVSGNASFSGGNITLGDNAADVTNFGALAFNSTGAVNITEDSSMALAASTGNNVTLISSGTMTIGGTLQAIGVGGAIDLLASAPVTLNGNILTNQGAVTIFNSAVLGSPATVTIDTTNGGTAGSGSSIVVTGTINNDLTATDLVLRAGTVEVLNLQGAVGGTTPISGLFATGNVVRLPAVQTTNVVNVAALGTNSFIVLNGDINTAQGASAGTVQLSGPVRLGNNVQITTDHPTGADGNVLFAPGSTVNEDPNNPGPRTLTILAGSGDVTFGGAVGDVTPLQGLNIASANDVTLQAVSTRDGGLTVTTASAGVDTNSIALNGDIDTTQGVGAGNLSFVGPVTLATNADINAGTGAISAPGSVTFSGVSTVTAGTLNAGSLVVSSGGASATVNAATTTNTVTISGGAAAFNGATTSTTLNLSGTGTLTGTGVVTLAGPGSSTWTGGTYTGTGQLVVGSTHTLTLGGGTKIFGTGTLVNNGTVVWSAGNIDVVATALVGPAVVNRGLFDVQANGGTFGDQSAGVGTITFNNELGATLRKSGPGLTAIGSSGGTTPNGVNFNNAGTVEVLNGTLSVNHAFVSSPLPTGTGTSSGTFSVAGGTALQFGGTNTLTSSSVVSGIGAVSVQHGTFSTVGNWSHTGTLAVNGGNATFTPIGGMSPSALTVAGGQGTFNSQVTTGPLAVSGGTAAFNAPASAVSLNLSGGTLTGAGMVTLAGPGSSSWTGGTYTGTGQLVVASGHTLTLSGAEKDFGTGTLANSGTVLWTGGNIDVVGNGTVLNHGLFDIQLSGGTFGDQSTGLGTITFNNELGATLRRSSGTGLATIGSLGVQGGTQNGVNLSNAGTMEVLSGALSINRGFNNAPAPAGSLTNTGTIFVGTGATLERLGGFTSAGVLSGHGTVDVGLGNVTSTGIVAPGGALSGDTTGTLSITGNYSQGTNGRLHIELESAAAGGFDVLAVSGNANIATAPNVTVLQANLAGGFVPAAGDRFRLMTFASRSGFFTSEILPPDFFVDQTYPGDLELVFEPKVAIADASVAEGNSGTSTALFNVSLSSPSGAPVTVNFSTADGTALAGQDYVAASGIVTFAPGETTQQIAVTVNGDATIEPDETFFVNLSGGMGILITDAQGLGTIVNDDNAFLSIAHYDAGTDTLSLQSQGDTTNDVTVTSPASNQLRITVGDGEAIVLSGDTGVGFTLSADGRQLDIDTSAAPINLFGIDLGEGADTLALSSNADSGLGSLTVDGGSGNDSVDLAATALAGSLSVTADSIMVDGTLRTTGGLGAAVTLNGSGTTTVLNDDIITAGGAITINDSVILGDEVTVTLDTTNGGAVATGANITLTGAINDDALASGLELLGGTGGIVTLSGSVGATLAPQNLTINAGNVAIQALVTTGTQSITAGSHITVAAGSSAASLNATGVQAITAGGTLTVQGGTGTGLTAQILGAAGQTIDASSIVIVGGSGGDSSFAEIRQTGATGIQQIEASSIAINGGISGTNNFARIRNDGTGAQTVTVTGPLTLAGGTGGAPDLGNFAQIRAVGAQVVEAGNTTLLAGGTGFSNFAGIHSPDQDITIHGNLVLTGGSSVAGATSAGAARIGGIGGAVPGPTNLNLEVETDVTMDGGTVAFAGAVIGSDFQGGQTTDITMLLGGSLTMNAGAVPNSGARIGSPSTNPVGGDILIEVGGDITMAGSAAPGALGTVIRTIGGEVTLDAAAAIFIGGSVLSGAQSVSAGGDITVAANGIGSAVLSATGAQSVTAGGVLALTGGSSGTNSIAQIISFSGEQTVSAATISLRGGTGGTNNLVLIQGITQFITAITGDVELRGGSGSGNSARIGGLGGGGAPDQPTNLTLVASRDVLLQGGNAAGTGALIGPAGTATPPPTPIAIEITAGRDVILNGGTAAAARIGGGNIGTALGDISIAAGASIQLNATTQNAIIRTLGSVNLDASTITIGGSVLSGALSVNATGNVTVAPTGTIGALVSSSTGPQTITAGGTLRVQGGTGTGLTAQILGSAGQTIDASSIVVQGGSVGDGSFAEILQTGAMAGQTIDASSITITGGGSGTNNFARIRNDGTGAQTIGVTGALSLSGGTGGAPDLGNFAQIRAVGAQNLTAGNTTLTAGGAGFSNFAGIHSPDQDITIHGSLTLTGGSSVAGPTSAGAARIGGIGGAVPGPTNLMLTVDGDIAMFGGTEVFAGAVIGSDFQGLQTTDITLDVGGNLTLGPGTVSNSGSRIGSPSAALAGGDISIVADGDITLNPSLTPGISGTVIRTLDALSLEAETITIGGQVTSGVQAVTASGGLTVRGTTSGVTTQLSATGGQTITAQFVEVIASGGSALVQNLTSGIQQITTSGMNADGEGLVVRSTSAGTFARIAEEVGDGVQTINVTNADRLAVDGVNGVGSGVGIAAEIRNITGTQTISMTGSGANAITVGSSGALGGSNINALTQTVTAGAPDEAGSITIIGTAANNVIAAILTNTLTPGGGPGTQTISTTGTISVTGGSAPTQGGNFNSGIFHNRLGLQSVTASDIVIQGGTSGTGNGAFVNSGNGGDQLITVTGGITLTGGSGAGTNNNRAGMNAINANQTIIGNPDIVVSGGASGGAVGLANTATIQAGAGKNQVINASSILVAAGTGGTDNTANITGGIQVITTLGDVTVNGGASDAGAAGIARIGGPGGLPTQLTLNVGGNLTLNAGSELPAAIGSNRTGGQPTDITINAQGSVVLNGGTNPAANPRIGSPQEAIAGGNIEIHAGLGLGTARDIVLNGGSQIRTLGAVALFTPGMLSLTGGSTGSGNAALIESNGNQTISASVIRLTGGAEGALDLGNFARITSVLGSQAILTNTLTLTAGTSGNNNNASITGPNQVITVNGDVTLTGGGSAASAVTGGGARIGGLGGATTGPTNLNLTVLGGGSVTMTGGTVEHAGAVLGSSFTGGQPTNIVLNVVGGSLTMNPGTVPNSGARIGSPSTNPQGGNISITAGTNITMGGSLTVGALGTVIRTIGGEVTLNAGGAITIAGSVLSGRQTVSAGGNITVSATGLSSAVLNASGPQSIVAGGALTLQGGSAGSDRFALIFGSGQQTIDAAQITLQGGSGGTNNFAIITGSTQVITSAGHVELRGGQGINNNARIGGLGGGGAQDQPTNLALTAGGNVLLQGANVTGAGAQIGPSGTGTPAVTNITITAGQNVILNAGAAAAARIGNGTNGAAGGSIISISAGDSIQLNGTAQSAVIRTGGNVELHAGSTISEAAAGFVVASELTTTSGGDTNLVGPNQVAVFNGSSVSGNITLNNTSPLLTITGISQASGAALLLSQAGNLAFTGSALSGSQTISATGNITISPVDGLGAIVSAAGAQTVSAGGGLIVQSSPVGIAQLQAGGGQEIHARYVEVTAGAQIIGGEQLIETSGKNVAGEGLALRGGLISQQVAGGAQTIIVTNADRVILDSPGGGVASILSNNGTQTLTITGAGSNALVLGTPGSLGISQMAGARVQEVIAGATGQAGSITITGRVADGIGTSLIVTSPVAGGTQTVRTSGTLSVFGGSVSTGDRAGIFANGFAADTDGDGDVDGGLQTISARSIFLQGGASGNVNRAEVAANRGSQLVTVGDGGISLTGGAGGTNNQAAIRQGVSPGVLPEESQPVSQTVTVTGGGISLQGGSGAGNGVFIAGADQHISSTGNVTLNSSGSAGNSAASIGSVSGRPTNLTLNAGGNIELTGGATNSAAFIGSAGTVPGQPNNLVIVAVGSVKLIGGTGSGARIGSSTAAAAAAGDISITAGGDIQLTGSATQIARIRTADNVTLTAGGSITEGNGLIEANSLTTHSGTGTNLAGPNQVAVFNATNTTSGDVTLVDAGGVTLTSISNPVGNISVTTTGNLSVSGSVIGGGAVVLAATGGSITDDADADIAVTGNASFTASGGITLGDQAGNVTNFGSLTFNAAGAVSISEDSGMTIRSGIASNNDISLSSAGTDGLVIIEGLNAGTGDIRLVANSVNQAGLGVVTADELGIIAANVTLVAAVNDVNTLAVEILSGFIGHIAVRDSDDLTIGAVAAGGDAGFTGATGIVGNGSDVDLEVGNLIVNQVLNTGNAGVGGDVRLVVETTVTQSSGGVITANELGILAGGNILLATAGNDVNTLAAASTGLSLIEFRDNDDLTIGTVPAQVSFIVTSGITSNGGDINLNVGSLSVDSSLDSGTHDISLTAPGGVLFTANAIVNVDLAGTGPSDFTNITISGAVTLDGTLDVDLANGFVPTDGNRFQFMTFASRGGFFGTTNLPTQFYVDQSDATDLELVFDTTAPTVTIDQALEQVDPTNASPILFTVVFSEAVLGFEGTDISFAGSTVGGTLAALVSGSGTSYTVSVTGMTSSGFVVASVAANAASDAAGNLSAASSSTDNTVTFVAAAGGIDLVGAVTWDPDDLLIPGDHEHVTVVVTNIGDTAVHDQVKVKIYASADEILDASDIFLDASHTGSNIQPGASKSAQLNFAFPSTLLPGHYFLLAVVDPENQIAESNELNNSAVGEEFDFHWMFGQVPGHGRETLTVRDADGTWVNFSLLGPGTGEITIENGEWDLVVTGTSSKSVLSILTLGGGDCRVELDDIHVTGALGAILAPRMDLTGTLAIEGALSAGMMIGSVTDAVIAAQTILGKRILGVNVEGIVILGDLENSEILIGADLGADGQLGGSGVDADTYSCGDLGDLLITGSMISSSVRVGQDPVDGVFDNGNDVLLDGSIDSITILGAMSGDSLFVADDLPLYARIEGVRVNTETDPRFIDSLPGSGVDPECAIDWNANAGSGWGAGCSPFGSQAGSGQSNFSDFSA